ncbi:hypothetical protein RUND412_008604 [Rhizina undulata]
MIVNSDTATARCSDHHSSSSAAFSYQQAPNHYRNDFTRPDGTFDMERYIDIDLLELSEAAKRKIRQEARNSHVQANSEITRQIFEVTNNDLFSTHRESYVRSWFEIHESSQNTLGIEFPMALQPEFDEDLDSVFSEIPLRWVWPNPGLAVESSKDEHFAHSDVEDDCASEISEISRNREWSNPIEFDGSESKEALRDEEMAPQQSFVEKRGTADEEVAIGGERQGGFSDVKEIEQTEELENIGQENKLEKSEKHDEAGDIYSTFAETDHSCSISWTGVETSVDTSFTITETSEENNNGDQNHDGNFLYSEYRGYMEIIKRWLYARTVTDDDSNNQCTTTYAQNHEEIQTRYSESRLETPDEFNTPHREASVAAARVQQQCTTVNVLQDTEFEPNGDETTEATISEIHNSENDPGENICCEHELKEEWRRFLEAETSNFQFFPTPSLEDISTDSERELNCIIIRASEPRRKVVAKTISTCIKRIGKFLSLAPKELGKIPRKIGAKKLWNERTRVQEAEDYRFLNANSTIGGPSIKGEKIWKVRNLFLPNPVLEQGGVDTCR